MAQEPFISIGEASQILGVSETALRQWTDEDKIKAFITPGGHRRYSQAELRKFMGSHSRTLGIKDLVIELEETTQLHREIVRTSLNITSWYNNLNDEFRERLAELGRRLLKIIIKYITEPSKREDIIKLAHDIGHDYGETLANLGLTLTDSVEAFVAHRSPIINTTTQLMRKREAFTERVAKAILLVDHVMDEVLVALVTSHQQSRNGIQKRIEGDVIE